MYLNVLFIFLFSYCGSVVAEDLLWQADCRERFPYLYWENNKCAGPGAVIVERAIAQLGSEHKIVWRLVPWARTISSVQSGELDLLPMHSCSNERDKFLKSIIFGYEKRTVRYFRHVDDKRIYNNFSDVKKSLIGALRDSHYSDEFNNSLDVLNLYPVTDVDQLINMLLLRRIDLAITSDIHGLNLFEMQSKFRPINYFEENINSRCISIPKKSSKIVYAEKLSQIIGQMQHNGVSSAIYASFGLVLLDGVKYPASAH